MAYAAEGRISQSPIEGGIEITDQQYADALDAMLAGREVTIDGGFAIRDKAPSPDHVWQGGEWVAPPAPPLPPQPDPEPPIPVCCAAAFGVLVVAGTIDVIEQSAGIAVALYLDVGSYLLFFTKPQVDTNYYPKVFNGEAKMQTVDKGEDYILISATDSNGDPVDPATFSVEIWRAY